MKKMLKLNELNKKEMIMVRGGRTYSCGTGTPHCGCGCQHSSSGGSGDNANLNGNSGGGVMTSAVGATGSYVMNSTKSN